jgi:hypothetical protein
MTNNKVAELREVFTAFIQPQVNPAKIMGNHVELETVELLNQLMLIVNSEVTRFKGHVRQFCVDDKGKRCRGFLLIAIARRTIQSTASHPLPSVPSFWFS